MTGYRIPPRVVSVLSVMVAFVAGCGCHSAGVPESSSQASEPQFETIRPEEEALQELWRMDTRGSAVVSALPGAEPIDSPVYTFPGFESPTDYFAVAYAVHPGSSGDSKDAGGFMLNRSGGFRFAGETRVVDGDRWLRFERVPQSEHIAKAYELWAIANASDEAEGRPAVYPRRPGKD